MPTLRVSHSNSKTRRLRPSVNLLEDGDNLEARGALIVMPNEIYVCEIGDEWEGCSDLFRGAPNLRLLRIGFNKDPVANRSVHKT